MKKINFDQNTEKEVLIDQQYEKFVQIEPGDLVVDLGCNIGYNYYLHQTKNIKYIGVDGSLECLTEFKNSLEKNDINCLLLNAFLLDKNEIVDLNDNYTNFKKQPVSTITLSQLFGYINKPIDFLKFDIEENEVFLWNTDVNYNLFKTFVKKFAGELHFKWGRKKILIDCLRKLKNDVDITFRLYSVDMVDITESFWGNFDYYTEIIIGGYVNKSQPPVGVTPNETTLIIPNNMDITYNFINGAILEITNGDINTTYDVSFIDSDTNETIYYDKIAPNKWIKCLREYYTNWVINVKQLGVDVFSYKMDLTDTKVFIALESSSLGDTLAWIPYVEEFRKKHKCEVICSTFHNNLFIKTYEKITFIEPGIVVNDIFAMYKIGCYDSNLKQKTDWNKIPLQKIACDILGLEYIEIKPKLNIDNIVVSDYITKKYPYVCIATESTAQCKLWNNDVGWQQTVYYLKSCGYSVINLSQNSKQLIGVDKIINGPIEKVMEYLKGCEFFIGLSSGLSWLSWACNKETILISGISEPWVEFQSNCIRVSPPNNVCKGCIHKFKFDKSDWNWCPEKKDFECTKLISPKQVISSINNCISGLHLKT